MTTESLDWSGDGPRSARFGDVYFSQVDGLAESRAVFLSGCGLPEAWAGRRRFTVAELGFGTGLNILAVVEAWRRSRPPAARLQIFSVEAYPISAADAARALSAWPELGDLARVLLDQWPDGRRGLRRIDFPQAGAILDLAIAEAGEALADWDGRADAWFLDGFAPAKNPAMWEPELLAGVATHSAPGARAATFTVAGAVRRGLEAAGFEVEKKPGFGRKRERLEARLPGAAADPPPPRVAVVGAGVAGASLARALRALGVEPVVAEAVAPGAGASGNPAALVTPRLDAGLGPVAALHAQAFARAVALYRRDAPAAILAEGVLQTARTERDAARFARIAAWEGFAPASLEPTAAGVRFRDGLTVEPAAVLDAWLGGAPRIAAEIARLERAGGAWRLFDREDRPVGEAEVVCLAAGPGAVELTEAPLRAVRGQVSWTGRPFAGEASAWGGYAAPMRGGVLFGATHDRDDWATDVRAEDHQRNLESLRLGRPDLAEGLSPEMLHGRASVRAATPDHLPLAGAAGEGLLLLAGLGGRGFTLAPLLAEQVAAVAAGVPGPLPRRLATIVEPARYGVPGGAMRACAGARRASDRKDDAGGLRMDRTVAATLLGLAAALCTGVAAEAAQANACFWSRDITNWRGVGDKVVNLEVNHRDIYRLDLARACPELKFAHQSLVLDAGGIGGPVCASSLPDIIVPSQGNFRCPVQSITKLSKEEAKALPKKERP